VVKLGDGGGRGILGRGKGGDRGSAFSGYTMMVMTMMNEVGTCVLDTQGHKVCNTESVRFGGFARHACVSPLTHCAMHPS
jgi:hypothetical protein